MGARDIGTDSALGAIVLLYPTGDVCQDPFDLSITFGVDKAMSAFWVCYRSNPVAGGSPFFNWSAQWLRVTQGLPVTPNAGSTNASPTVKDVPYKISALTSAESSTSQPAIAWVHDLDGGGQRVETWRVQVYTPDRVPLATGRVWANTTTQADAVSAPAMAVIGNSIGPDTAVAG